MTVNLIHGYFVEIDDMNHTLKKRKMIEKDGEEKEVTSVIGYFPNLRSCIEKLVKIGALDISDKEFLAIKEYSDLIEKNCEMVMDLIAEMDKRGDA